MAAGMGCVLTDDSCWSGLVEAGGFHIQAFHIQAVLVSTCLAQWEAYGFL